MTTVGFELEFELNADRVAQWLSANNNNFTHGPLIGDSTLHRYHCDCRVCRNEQYVLRAQTDSTCSGEIVTNIFDLSSDTEKQRLAATTRILQEAAVAVDATPGYQAGLHVHVKRPVTGEVRVDDEYVCEDDDCDLFCESGAECEDCSHTHRRSEDQFGDFANEPDLEMKVEAFYNFLLWEPVILQSLAPGRFTRIRSMNRSTVELAQERLNSLVSSENLRRERSGESYDNNYHQIGGPIPLEETASLLRQEPETLKKSLYLYNGRMDRHSNLCTNTRYGTWEFRLWNSTRAAWRMDMAVQMSALWLTDDEFIKDLSEHTPEPSRLSRRSAQRNTETLLTIIEEHNPETAELVRRQVDYIASVGGNDQRFRS